MKKLILVCTMLSLITPCPAQRINATEQSPEVNSYFRKSKRQSTAAIVLLSGGVIMNLVGIVAFNTGTNSYFRNFPSNNESAYNTSEVFTAAGTICMVASIPFFVISGINKKHGRAAMISIRRMQYDVPAPYLAAGSASPEISLQIRF